MSRHITRSLHLAVPPTQAFGLLVTPSAIRRWWGAAQAVVLAQPGGLWVATWGESEDQPDYITAARIAELSVPHRLLLSDFLYQATTPLPFDAAHLTTEFTVEAAEGGSLLTVTQNGFPDDAIADEFYGACQRGWAATFDGISRFVAETT